MKIVGTENDYYQSIDGVLVGNSKLYPVEIGDIVVSVDIRYNEESTSKRWTRELVGFSDDEETRKALKSNLSTDLLNAIVEQNWEGHYDDEVDHYHTDLEDRLAIKSYRGIKADLFWLDYAKIYFDGVTWVIANEQGQKVFLDTWNDDKPSLKWEKNVLDDRGESDYFANENNL